MTEVRKRRRSGPDTDRQRAMRASAAHLRDLKRAHGRPPADVKLSSAPIPARLCGPPVASYCASTAQLCAELVR